MSRDYQQFQDYQYGNNEQYYYNNPQQTYYPNYPPQGEYYGPAGPGPQTYGAQYDYGPYSNLNYYNNYNPQQDNYYDPNAYGYEGEYYQGVAQSADGSQGTQVGTDGNGAVKQPARGKHSYSQNRNRNRQRTDIPLQGENVGRNGTGKDVKDDDKGKAGNDENAAAWSSNDRGNVRGRKQGGRFYGSDSRSKPFERRIERRGDSIVREVDTYLNGLRAEEKEFETENESRKGYRQQREERGKSDRSKVDKYGKENLPDRQRYNARRDENTDNSQKQVSDENVNNNSTNRDYGRRANSQISGVLRVDLRKNLSGGDEIRKKENKDDDDKTTFDYRNEGGASQKIQQGRHQRRMPRNKATKRVDESQRGIHLFLLYDNKINWAL